MERRSTSPIKVEADRPSAKAPIDDADYAAYTAEFGDGRLVKMDVDYSANVDEALPKADQLAKGGKVAEAVESLYALEKQTRLGCDMRSNNRILRAIVRLAFEGKNFALLNEVIVALCKKRSIIKFAIKNMIQDCCAMVDKIADETTRNKLIETLRQVTLGKIYVEVERARLTKRIVQKLEAENKLDEARKMIMELQVETYGSMEIKERVVFLLHQMRLTISQSDFLRASFIGRKISTKFFDSDADDVQDLKLEYYKYMIEIGLHNEEYLDVCKHFRAVFDTPKIQQDPAKAAEAMKCVVLYALLSPHDNEQWDLIHRINATRQLELIPEYKELLELFINQEIISWSETTLKKYESMLRHGSTLSPATNVFSEDVAGNKKFERLRERVGEHNVRMVAKYYTQITFQRMAELLEYSVDEMEKFVCHLIVSGVIADVKIHRPQQTIHFKARRANVETLDEWGSGVRQLTDILNKVSHLILKEEMVHKHIEL